MSKKSRRTKAKRRARAAKPIQAKHPQTVKPVTAKLPSPIKISHEAQDSINRYQHVIPEVKRIGILAGSMILILIILSFVL